MSSSIDSVKNKVLVFIYETVRDAVAFNMDEEQTIKHVATMLDLLFGFKSELLEAYDYEAFEFVIKQIFGRLSFKKVVKKSENIVDKIGAIQRARVKASLVLDEVPQTFR
jgi:hypothetical protein